MPSDSAPWPNSGFLTAAGHTLEYRFSPATEAGRPTVVLLHEGLGSLAQWRDFPDKVAARTGCATLTYSRYGFGQSDPLAEPRNDRYLHDEASVALPEVLAHFGITAPVLIGHSDGGTIALLHAAAGLWPVRGMVVIAPHIFLEDISIAGLERAYNAFHHGGLRRSLAPWHRDVDAMFAGWADLWLNPSFRSWNIEHELPGIACPLLLMQGELDQYGSPEQVHAVARHVSGPAEVMLLPDCGHAPHAELPDVVLDAIVRFISEHEHPPRLPHGPTTHGTTHVTTHVTTNTSAHPH